MGELHKRIENMQIKPSWVKGDYALITKHKVLEIVGEMRKEFPIEVIYHKGEPAFKFLNQKNAQKKIGETILWFVKWLAKDEEARRTSS